MVSYSLQSLSDLCGVRVAYLLWTRRNFFIPNLMITVFVELSKVVLMDVKSLKLPQQLHSRVAKFIKPTGRQLITLLSIWFSKTQFENSPESSLERMLFESLVLNPDGFINRRKTAEKILHSRILPKDFAFRLASVNYLKNEVLKLWIYVKVYFLKKLMFDMRESSEVMYWIRFCLLQEKSITFETLPHFSGYNVSWNRFSIECALTSDNVACLDYFNGLWNGEMRYNYIEMFLTNLNRRREPDNVLYNSLVEYPRGCLVFNFARLDFELIAELFQRHSEVMVNIFLSWPLSQTFVDNVEEIWNLIPEDNKNSAITKIYRNIFDELFVPLPESDFALPRITNGDYLAEHIEIIWTEIWKIISDSQKLFVLNNLLFTRIEDCIPEELQMDFANGTWGLRDKLFEIFLSNGEAFFLLYSQAEMKACLESVIANYLPNEFKEIKLRYISLLETFVRGHHDDSFYLLSPQDFWYCIDGEFLNMIENILYSMFKFNA